MCFRPSNSLSQIGIISNSAKTEILSAGSLTLVVAAKQHCNASYSACWGSYTSSFLIEEVTQILQSRPLRFTLEILVLEAEKMNSSGWKGTMFLSGTILPHFPAAYSQTLQYTLSLFSSICKIDMTFRYWLVIAINCKNADQQYPLDSWARYSIWESGIKAENKISWAALWSP